MSGRNRADRAGVELDGILVVAKPAGPTSHDIVALVRETGTFAVKLPPRTPTF